MIFYCPNCRKEVEAEPSGTITTKNGRTAYKAMCPTCNQDMSEFAPEKSKGEAAAAMTVATDAIDSFTAEKTAEPAPQVQEKKPSDESQISKAPALTSVPTAAEPSTLGKADIKSDAGKVRVNPDQTVKAYIAQAGTEVTEATPSETRVIEAQDPGDAPVTEFDAQNTLNQAAQQVGSAAVIDSAETKAGSQESAPIPLSQAATIPQSEPVKIAETDTTNVSLASPKN